MNHPTREELSQFLYKELPAEQQSAISGHIHTCAECRSQVEAWQSVRKQLASWKIPAQRRPFAVRWPTLAPGFALRWAAAAAILFLAGYLLARITDHPSAASPSVRAAIAAEVRQELRAELAKFTATESQGQAQFRDSLMKTLGRLEAQRLLDYASLRRDVETVAVRAQDELISTRQSLASLEQSQPPTINQ
jgi:hypothetical protein